MRQVAWTAAARALLERAQERAALLAEFAPSALTKPHSGQWSATRPHSVSEASAPAARPARMSVSFCTSSPVMVFAALVLLGSGSTSSARRMSIFPCRIRRL